MEKDWIVFRQVKDGPCVDLWNAEYVDITAEDNTEACRLTAMDRGEGRYMAFPNEYAVYFDINIKKIAEVTVGGGESIV